MRTKVELGRPQLERGADQTLSARKPRVDAKRNRDLLVNAGKAVFAESGGDASLEEIARRAGVGIGTLYRHFPTRDAMIEAVYCREVEYLVNWASRLEGLSAPGEALYQWMQIFVDYIATKKVLASALCSTIPGASELAVSSGVQILEAMTLLVDRAVASGDIRSDVMPGDLLRALAGFTHGGMGPNWEPSARRLIDLLMDGVRTPGTKGGFQESKRNPVKAAKAAHVRNISYGSRNKSLDSKA